MSGQQAPRGGRPELPTLSKSKSFTTELRLPAASVTHSPSRAKSTGPFMARRQAAAPTPEPPEPPPRVLAWFISSPWAPGARRAGFIRPVGSTRWTRQHAPPQARGGAAHGARSVCCRPLRVRANGARALPPPRWGPQTVRPRPEGSAGLWGETTGQGGAGMVCGGSVALGRGSPSECGCRCPRTRSAPSREPPASPVVSHLRSRHSPPPPGPRPAQGLGACARGLPPGQAWASSQWGKTEDTVPTRC